jgi:copper chaperone NosL
VKSIAASSILMIMLLVGCSEKPKDAPPQIRYGQDECAHCGMIVSDERFAAALRVIAGGQQQDLIFDDIGDMIEYERGHESVQIQKRLVHDFDTHQWIDASHAFYLKSERIHSPMGSGILALGEKDAALKRASEVEAQATTLDALRTDDFRAVAIQNNPTPVPAQSGNAQHN